MQIEFRADGARISGYVNAVERQSRPVMTPMGRVVEEIEAGAFARALERAGDVPATVDHDPARVCASTGAGTLELREDAIGLHAELTVTDGEVIRRARRGEIRGWSFGMKNVQAELEERADKLPLRRVKELDLDHVTLVLDKCPVYSATSVEVRAGEENTLETRAREDAWAGERYDNSEYRERLNKIQKGRKNV